MAKRTKKIDPAPDEQEKDTPDAEKGDQEVKAPDEPATTPEVKPSASLEPVTTPAATEPRIIEKANGTIVRHY